MITLCCVSTHNALFTNCQCSLSANYSTCFKRFLLYKRFVVVCCFKRLISNRDVVKKTQSYRRSFRVGTRPIRHADLLQRWADRVHFGPTTVHKIVSTDKRTGPCLTLLVPILIAEARRTRVGHGSLFQNPTHKSLHPT